MKAVSKKEIVDQQIQPLLKSIYEVCEKHDITIAVAVHSPDEKDDSLCLELHNCGSETPPEHLQLMLGVLMGNAVPVKLGSLTDELKQKLGLPAEPKPSGVGTIEDFLKDFKKP